MLLTLTLHASDAAPATDLGYLLHKHPARIFESALPFGTARVFYPENTAERSAAALLLDVDPVALSRRFRGGHPNAPLEPYVNDRPYASGSFLALALRDAFGTALSGRSKDRQAVAELALPFEIELPCLPVRGPADLPERLFGPLGYAVDVTPIALDPRYPEWGERPYVALKLGGTVRLRDLLAHLYVLLPVLDTARKHHFLDEAELEKLLRRGEGWLEAHPERDLIATRYLQLRSLIRQATEHFAAEHFTGQGETDSGDEPAPETAAARTVHAGRLAWVAEQLRASGAQTVLDLGCGEGRLLKMLLPVAQFRELVGLDVSARALEIARRRLKLDERPELEKRVRLLHGSLTYRDARLRGFGAAVLAEVIEHLDVGRLEALAANVFGDARPSTV
ncbi:3' terminal RNA ribose 2'-O-methyltransferase Hen1, partial [Deinococcus sp.]|uniref:3' terminal RNA ribose 2'-O-methyltransferase Hen1 n=1 Tax=Deinococcus sp. TaxID=47478 RepID=UPI0025E97001